MQQGNAINILNSSIDSKICGKDNPYKRSSSPGEEAGKCGIGKSSSSTAKGLSKLWDTTTTGGSDSGGDYDRTSIDKMGGETSKTISNDTAALTREEKGVVSSVFAKVIVLLIPRFVRKVLTMTKLVAI